jgi:hypothetical protein
MFNPAAFTDTGSDYVLGNAAREYSSLRGNPYRNENLTARKSFPIGEWVKATLQVDFYNAFNRALLGASPDTNIRDTSFGRVTGGGQSNSNRQGQGMLKIEF